MAKYKLNCIINVTTIPYLSTVCVPNFHSNVPSSAFYGFVMSEVLRIARSPYSVMCFCEKTSALLTSMEKQGGNSENL